MENTNKLELHVLYSKWTSKNKLKARGNEIHYWESQYDVQVELC